MNMAVLTEFSKLPNLHQRHRLAQNYAFLQVCGLKVSSLQVRISRRLLEKRESALPYFTFRGRGRRRARPERDIKGDSP
jgi:hypothetical protein